MARLLDYATQVSELEKIARLSPRPVIERPLPALLAAQPTASCLVCGKRPARPCSACGGVSYCDVPHQERDARYHNAVCGALRTIAEDRRSSEPIGDLADRLATADVRAAAGWSDLLGRDLPEARLRRWSDLATRPVTLANALVGLPVTSETLNVHVIGAAQRELEVPEELWLAAPKLAGMDVGLRITLIGPEVPVRGPRHVGTRRGVYERALFRELGRPDLVIGYDCGLLMYPSWRATLGELRGSGVPFVITSFRDWEAAAEARLLESLGVSCRVPPAANPWASLVPKRSTTIANDVSYDNAFVSARG